MWQEITFFDVLKSTKDVRLLKNKVVIFEQVRFAMLDDLTVFYDHLHSQKRIYKKFGKAYIIPRKLNIVPYTMGNSKFKKQDCQNGLWL